MLDKMVDMIIIIGAAVDIGFDLEGVALPLLQVAENLAQLMYSVMMTGYMFKNAQYRLELQQSLEQVALPDVQEPKVHLSSECLRSIFGS